MADIAATSPKMEFILVPGAWHSPDAFGPTTALLKAAGFEVHGVTLASYGAQPPLQSFAPDADIIRSKVDSVLATGKDVVIIFHSYGSAPGCEALSEYLKTHSAAGSKGGSIKRLVFCASFILPEGGSLMGALQGNNLPWFIVKGDEVRPDKPEEIFYNDLDSATANKYIAALKPHSYRTFFSELTVAPWKTIPSTYIICEKDMAIPLPAQEGMIAMAQQMAPGSFDVVERCTAGHSPFISQPEWLAEKLIKSASS